MAGCFPFPSPPRPVRIFPVSLPLTGPSLVLTLRAGCSSLFYRPDDKDVTPSIFPFPRCSIWSSPNIRGLPACYKVETLNIPARLLAAGQVITPPTFSRPAFSFRISISLKFPLQTPCLSHCLPCPSPHCRVLSGSFNFSAPLPLSFSETRVLFPRTIFLLLRRRTATGSFERRYACDSILARCFFF